MQRRTLLRLGLGGAVVLALAGGGIAWMRPGLVSGRLAPAGREIFRAVARAVLDGSLPRAVAPREAALNALLDRLDTTLAAFPAATQSELSQLLALLAAPPGRLALAGLRPDWPAATAAELQQALNDMNHSGLALRQQAYHALRDLTNAAWFADPQAWGVLGYPGPRQLESAA